MITKKSDKSNYYFIRMFINLCFLKPFGSNLFHEVLSM